MTQEEINEEVEVLDKERFIQLPKKYLQQKSATADSESGKVRQLPSSIDVSDPGEIELKVEIPVSEYQSGAVYTKNNCFYDSDGEFLYKISTKK